MLYKKNTLKFEIFPFKGEFVGSVEIKYFNNIIIFTPTPTLETA